MPEKADASRSFGAKDGKSDKYGRTQAGRSGAKEAAGDNLSCVPRRRVPVRTSRSWT